MVEQTVADGSRRALLAGLALSGFAAGAGSAAPKTRAGGSRRGGKVSKAQSYYAYVGARTTKDRGAHGDGLNVYRVDTAGRWTHLQLLADLVNPSFLAFDRTGRFLYTVHGDLSEVTALRIDARTGRLERINQQSTEGKNPVHLVVDPTNKFLIVANHITSTLAVLPINADGSLGKLVGLTPLTGKIGPHRVEQPFPKPHQAVYDRAGRFIAVPDKGADHTYTYSLDAQGKLTQLGPGAASREGAGPRRIAFSPEGGSAYILNELASSITVCSYDKASGALTPIQTLSSLPDTFCEDSRAAEIEISPDGRFVYASNRGHDSIGVFAVEAAGGRLSPVHWQPTFGKTPRFLTIDPANRFLFAANEESDTIVTFAVDAGSGRLTRVGDPVNVGSPVCIVLKPIEA